MAEDPMNADPFAVLSRGPEIIRPRNETGRDMARRDLERRQQAAEAAPVPAAGASPAVSREGLREFAAKLSTEQPNKAAALRAALNEQAAGEGGGLEAAEYDWEAAARDEGRSLAELVADDEDEGEEW
jgi:hypothetical protein